MLNIEFGFPSWSLPEDLVRCCSLPKVKAQSASQDPCSVLYVPPTPFGLAYGYDSLNPSGLKASLLGH